MKKTVIALALTGILALSGSVAAFASEDTAASQAEVMTEGDELGALLEGIFGDVNSDSFASEVEGLVSDLGLDSIAEQVSSELGLDSLAETISGEVDAMVEEALPVLEALSEQDTKVAEALNTLKDEEGNFDMNKVMEAVTAVFTSESDTLDINGVTLTEEDITSALEGIGLTDSFAEDVAE